MTRASWLNLHEWIPQRDVRKLVYGYLNAHDLLLVERAHGVKKTPITFSFMKHVVGCGYLEIVKWATDDGYYFGARLSAHAAKCGQLYVLQMLRERGCYVDATTCANAARYGHLDVLKFARLHGCPWDQRTLLYAKRKGHQHVVEWALQNGAP